MTDENQQTDEIEELTPSFKHVRALDRDYKYFLMGVSMAYYDELENLFNTFKKISESPHIRDVNDPMLVPHAVLEITLDYFLKLPNHDVLIVADCLIEDCKLWCKEEYLRSLNYYYDINVEEPFTAAMLDRIVSTASMAAFTTVVSSGLIGMTENPLSFCEWRNKYSFVAKGMRKTDLCSFLSV